MPRLWRTVNIMSDLGCAKFDLNIEIFERYINLVNLDYVFI